MLVAIEGGGDWADASVDYLRIPGEPNLHALHEKYNEWYREVYRRSFRPHKDGYQTNTIPYLTFAGYLKQYHGAVEADGSDLTVFRDG